MAENLAFKGTLVRFGLVQIGLVWFHLVFDVEVYQRGLTYHTYRILVQQDKKWLKTQHLKVNWFGLVWFGLVWFGFVHIFIVWLKKLSQIKQHAKFEVI